MSALDRWLTHDPREEWPPLRPDECRCDLLDDGETCGPCERAIEDEEDQSHPHNDRTRP